MRRNRNKKASKKEKKQVCEECWDLDSFYKKRLEGVSYLDKDYDFYRRNYALLLACGRGHLECVKASLAKGADVNFIMRYWLDTWCPLYNAVAEKNVDCVEFLIKAGADVNIRYSQNKTVLYRAVHTGSVKCVDLLLKAGADVNVTDNAGATVLFHGQWGLHPTLPKCIKRVLRENIKVNVRSGHRYEVTVLTYLKSLHLSSNKPEEEFAMLLFAAGDTLDETEVEHIPEYLKPTDEVSIMNICRGAIRKHLLQISDINLFPRIPKLGLPSVMSQYLLYNVSLDYDEGK